MAQSLPNRARLLEKYTQVVREDGLNTNKNVNIGINGVTASLWVSGNLSVGGTQTFTGASALAATTTIGGILVPVYEYVTSQALAAAAFANGSTYPIYTFPNDGFTWKVVAASVRFTTAASAAATAQIEVSASGTAPGSGTVQLTAGMALNGSANTVVNGTVIASPTTIAAGASLNIQAGGAATTDLVGMVITVALQRVS